MIDVKVVSAGDVDAIHELETRAFPAPWRREFFESELRASGRLNLVAKRDGKLVGYVFTMWFFDEMHVNKIAVVETERRTGVARLLMDKCFEFARRHGIETVGLEVRESNFGAQEFYKHLGFSKLYVRPRYYPDGEAAVVMLCKLVRQPRSA